MCAERTERAGEDVNEATSPYAGINRIRFGVVLPDLSADRRLPPMSGGHYGQETEFTQASSV